MTTNPSTNIRVRDLSIGPISRSDLVRYAGAGGDFNAIHHDELKAIEAGYVSVIAMGLYPAGILAAHLASSVGHERLLELAVRFMGVVYPGDILTFSAAPTEDGDRPDEANGSGHDGAGVILECEVRNDRGETVLQGRCRVGGGYASR